MSDEGQKHEIELAVIHCSECDVVFGVTSSFKARRTSDKRTFHCPNGHGQWYPAKCECGAIFKKDASLAEHQGDCGTHIDKLLGITGDSG